MSDAVEIERFLAQEGYTTACARRQARTLLERAGLTRPGKRAMAMEKLPRARAVLAAGSLRLCGDPECAQLAQAGPRLQPGLVARVAPTSCQVCGGSNNRRAARALVARLAAAGIERLLVVGGTPALHAELDRLLTPHGVELRCVDGTRGSHTAKEAAQHLRWAQVVVIWGATPLPHKVSALYVDAPPGTRVVKLARRGIEALCRAVLQSLA
jgi:hypothetical protein